jgi:hypothetical protein
VAAGEPRARGAPGPAGTGDCRRVGRPTSARDGQEALANVLGFRGDHDAARLAGERAYELAVAADDADVLAMVLMDLATQSAYAGRHDEAAGYEATFAALVERTGSVTGRALLAYVRGECRAERGDPAATRYLEEAVTVAEEAELSFAAGVARHTLVTSSARAAGDPAAVLPTLGPLIDHWHGFGSWTQLWMAVRVLVETLSRLGCHREATVLLGALAASPRASRVYGSDSRRIDAVETAAASRSATPSRSAGPRGPRSGTSGPSPSPAVSPALPHC